jgi:hypothetical protein
VDLADRPDTRPGRRIARDRVSWLVLGRVPVCHGGPCRALHLFRGALHGAGARRGAGARAATRHGRNARCSRFRGAGGVLRWTPRVSQVWASQGRLRVESLGIRAIGRASAGGTRPGSWARTMGWSTDGARPALRASGEAVGHLGAADGRSGGCVRSLPHEIRPAGVFPRSRREWSVFRTTLPVTRCSVAGALPGLFRSRATRLAVHKGRGPLLPRGDGQPYDEQG